MELLWANWMGAALVAASGLGLGGALAKPFGRRVVELKGWQTVLERMESDIRWQAHDLTDALAEATAGAPPGVREAVAAFVRQASLTDARTADIWAAAIDEAGYLSQEDRLILIQLGPVLGRYSRVEQVTHLSFCRKRLEAAERIAVESRDRQGKAISTMVTLAGLAFAILLV